MLDPQNKRILDELAAPGAPRLHTMAPADARKGDGFLAGVCRGEVPQEAVGRAENHTIPGPAGKIPIRVYTPRETSASGALVFFHGGGFVLGSLDSHDDVCRALTNNSGCVVISVAYRLAPEHKFPAAPEDCYAAVKWVAENAGTLGYPDGRIAVGGDSAGGNLSAVVSLMARDKGGPKIRFQLLIYPGTSPSMDWPSIKELGKAGYFIDTDDMAWFHNHYLRGHDDEANPYAFPANAKDLSGLPPALVITAELDPLRDMGEAYAARLKEAGVPTTLTRYDGVTHVFVNMAPRVDAGKTALKQAGAAVREALTK
ncbi:MAG: alpha/beta hydrolase [Candidatus Binataceae bacterium]